MKNKKQSEIGVAQNLISELASLPAGQIFSLDTLHTQTATVAAIAAAGHHYLAGAVLANEHVGHHFTIEHGSIEAMEVCPLSLSGLSA